MSDRCAVQKKFNDLFIEFRKNILKNATKNFDSYSVEQQEKMTKVNQFFLWLALFGWFGRPGRSLLKSVGGNVVSWSKGGLPESWRILKG